MGELKPGWRRVKFGEVVRQVKDRVDPESSGLKRFIAGEHMDTDDLRIRRWGEIGDDYLGPAFHMRFQPGQVLYGSRRTYLRKVAVADFEGICANTTFVLESADPAVLLPELLPFIMQTESFHEHSKRESKGSVNPYVNFSDLAWYEFALPPIEEQLRAVNAARASSAVCEALRNALLASAQLADSFCAHVIDAAPPDCQHPIGDVCKFTSGKRIPVSTLSNVPSASSTIPVYGGNGVAGFTTEPLPGMKGRTLVVGRVGQYCGVTTLTSGPAWITDNALYPVKIDDSVTLDFLALCLRGRRLNRGKLGEYLPLITQGVVHSTYIPIPQRSVQERLVGTLLDIESASSQVRSRLVSADRQHSLVLREF